MIVNKPLDLGRLHNELVAAGIPLVGLQLNDGELLRTLADGTTSDLPPEAGAIVTAHTVVDPAAQRAALRAAIANAATLPALRAGILAMMDAEI